jgi:hypothetical protein
MVPLQPRFTGLVYCLSVGYCAGLAAVATRSLASPNQSRSAVQFTFPLDVSKSASLRLIPVSSRVSNPYDPSAKSAPVSTVDASDAAI